MKTRLLATATVAIVAAVAGHARPSLAVDPSRIENADRNPNDWLTYHGSYKSWHYSPLDQINTANVKNLQVAWMHSPGRVTRGLQSFPLVADGVLYYTGPYSRVFALDAATGQVIWSFIPKLDEDLIAAQTHTPYTRGIALGHGHVYVGSVDGRLFALDMQTGKQVWENKLINSEKLTVGFTGAPLVVKDKIVIGAQGGEWPYRGPIFGVDGKTGETKWEFDTAGGTPEAQKTWGNESYRVGGGGWMPGAYYYRVRSSAPYQAPRGNATGRGRRWRAGRRGSATTSGGWATCWATPTGARRCGPTRPGCCCPASARAWSRWPPGSTRPGSAPRTSPCTTSSPRPPGTPPPCSRRCGPTRSRRCWSAAPSGPGSWTTPGCRRRASCRSAWRASTAASSASGTTVRWR